MKTKFFLSTILCLALAAGAFAQCSSNKSHNYTQTTNHQQKDLVGVAVGDAQFSTLVAALTSADLVPTLQEEGPYTVFAPVNTAFSKLPEGTVASLLRPENKQTLTEILTYHVVKGKFSAQDVLHAIENSGGSFTIETISGRKLVATASGNTVLLTDENGDVAAVTKTDLSASNGVVHVIDAVVLPL